MSVLAALLLEVSAGLMAIGAGIGAGIVTLGAGLGIGRLASSTMESMARQPEASGDLRTSMLIAAALIEGVALFGLVICIIALFVL